MALLVVVFVFTLASSFFTILVSKMVENFQPLGLVFLASVMLGLAAVFLASRVEKAWLENSSARLWLEVTTLLGSPVSSRWTTYVVPVGVDIEFPSNLSFPPSILALLEDPVKGKQGSAVGLFRAAIIGLIGSKQCRICHYQTCRRIHPFPMSALRTVVALAYLRNRINQLREIGALEARILSVLPSAVHEQGSSRLYPSDQEEEIQLYELITIYDLVRAVISKKKTDPVHWVVTLVTSNATSQGWGHKSGIRFLPFGRFQLESSLLNQYRLEQQAFIEANRSFLANYWYLYTAVTKEIRRGINSMEKSSC